MKLTAGYATLMVSAVLVAVFLLMPAESLSRGPPKVRDPDAVFFYIDSTEKWKRIQHNWAYFVLVHDSDKCVIPPAPEDDPWPEKRLSAAKKGVTECENVLSTFRRFSDKFRDLSFAVVNVTKNESTPLSELRISRQFVTFFCPKVNLPAMVLLHSRNARATVIDSIPLSQWEEEIEKRRHTLEYFLYKRWKAGARKQPLPELSKDEQDEQKTKDDGHDEL